MLIILGTGSRIGSMHNRSLTPAPDFLGPDPALTLPHSLAEESSVEKLVGRRIFTAPDWKVFFFVTSCILKPVKDGYT